MKGSPAALAGTTRKSELNSLTPVPACTLNRADPPLCPVTGQSGGSARFVVQAGTGVSELSSDFLVVPAGAAGEPFTGGDYSAASATLQVSGTGCNPALTIVQGAGGNLTLSFPPCSGRTHIVEARSGLADVTGWQALPGAPHNSGSVTVANQGGQRFFRLRITNP